jgi:hypothetical protein
LLDRVGERTWDPSCELRVSGEETWVLLVVGVVASYAVLKDEAENADARDAVDIAFGRLGSEGLCDTVPFLFDRA